jgi:hypothetical protein
MIEQIFPILLVLLTLGLIWSLLKFILKLTSKIFSYGCLVILVIGAFIIFLGGDLAVF